MRRFDKHGAPLPGREFFTPLVGRSAVTPEGSGIVTRIECLYEGKTDDGREYYFINVFVATLQPGRRLTLGDPVKAWRLEEATISAEDDRDPIIKEAML